MEPTEFDRVTALIELAIAWKKLAERHGSTFSPTPRCRQHEPHAERIPSQRRRWSNHS